MSEPTEAVNDEPAPKRKRKPKQTRVPGTEAKVIKAITYAAEEYADLRDERMELGKKEVEARDRLLGLLDQHGLEEYVDPDVGVKATREAVVKAKVKRLKDSDEE